MLRRALTALLALAVAFGLGWTLAAQAAAKKKTKKPTPVLVPAPAPAPTPPADAPIGTGDKCTSSHDCKGPVPRICLNCTSGLTHCAHWTCDAGSCNITICPVAAPTPPPAAQCKVAKDCKGPLPKLCQTCKNGKSACAHHVCTAHACATEICPP